MTVKLLTFLPRLEELETHSNPFGILTAAHLHALAGGSRTTRRGVSKFRLFRNLALHAQLSREQIRILMLVVDGVLELSGRVEQKFLVDYKRFEEEVEMNRILSTERAGWEKGLREGRQEGLKEGRQEGEKALARKMLALGVSKELVLQATGLTEKELEADTPAS